MSSTKMYKIYPIKTYSGASQQFINNYSTEYKLAKIIELLTKNDRGYHVRIHTSSSYTFFGDLDNYDKDMDTFKNIMVDFLHQIYGICIGVDDILYTKNFAKQGSFHYSIPSLHCSCIKLKEIHKALKKIVSQIDTTIYSEHWFRLPNQSKEQDSKTIHKIITGEMKDHFIEFINKDSICIDDNEMI